MATTNRHQDDERDLEDGSIIFENPATFAATILNFKLLPYQEEFLNGCRQKKRIVGIWSRQSGKSTTIAIYCLWHAMMYDEATILIISPTQEQSNLLFQKIIYFTQKHPYLQSRLSNQKADQMEFYNKSTIKALPTGAYGSTIRGHTANVIILEESGIIKSDIVHEVIFPMGASHPDLKIIQIGTPRGKNHFFQATTSAQYTLFTYDYTHPLKHQLFTQEFILEQQEMLTTQQFNTEFGCSFIEDIDLYFPPSLVDSCVNPELPALPPEKGHHYALGVDLAREGADSTVFAILEIAQHQLHKHRLVGLMETQKKPLTDAIGRIKQLHSIYHFDRIIVDETGLGGGPVDLLKEEFPTVIKPFTFTIETKQDLYSNLKILLEKKKIELPQNKKLYYELTDFRYEVLSTGKMRLTHAPHGHDDYVAALALAAYVAAGRKAAHVIL